MPLFSRLPQGGGSSGTVMSVNGKTGTVVLNAADLGIEDIMSLRGQVANYAALPTNAITGDVWQTADTTNLWAMTDSGWVDLGASDIDLSQYVTTAQMDAAFVSHKSTADAEYATKTDLNAKQTATTAAQAGEILTGGVTAGTFSTINIDDTPISGSANLVTSGGIFNAIVAGGGGGGDAETDPIAMAKLNSLFDTNGQLLPQYLPSGVTTPTQLVAEQPTNPDANTLYIFPNANGQYQTQFYDGTTWHVVGDFTSVTDLSNYLTSDQIAATYATITDLTNTNAGLTAQSSKLSTHIQTDIGRWKQVYDFEIEIIDSVLNAKGMKRDTANNLSFTRTYTVTDDLGGLLTAAITNTTSGGTAQISINGVLKYDSTGLQPNVPVTVYFPLKDGDYVNITGSEGTFTFTPYIADPGSSQQQMLATITTLTGRVGSLQSQIDDLSASLANKTVAGVTPVDITNTSYTVNNALGARITGQGAQVLGLLGITVAATGTVTVNGTQVYNNTALLSGTPEVLSINVDDGAVISSSGMAYVDVYNYVAG